MGIWDSSNQWVSAGRLGVDDVFIIVGDDGPLDIHTVGGVGAVADYGGGVAEKSVVVKADAYGASSTIRNESVFV